MASVPVMYVLGLLTVPLVLAELGSPLSLMRAAKCLVPNGLEHTVRTALLQQCISKNYAQGNETQCYPELGCFPMDSPWTTSLRPFPTPLHPAEIDVRLYCYTRDSAQRYNISLWPEPALNGCPFNKERRTAFVTHGFASNGNSSWVSKMKDNYLQEVDANVFLVDWGGGAQLLNYLQVASNTRIAGAELGRFISFMTSSHGLDLDKVHLLGHSLGAHISAYAAKANPGIQRLTAMDPAQPGFEGEDQKVRLDKEDAKYIEVIHTNAAPFIPALGFGLILPHGHVDFYMNGGLRQPGCHIPNITEIKGIKDLAKFPVEVVNMWVSCSHGRSYEYYMQALQNNCNIWGRVASLTRHIINAGTFGFIEPLFSKLKKCDPQSCSPLGLDTPNFKARGTFAAATPKSSPYCEDDPDVNQRLLGEVTENQEEITTQISDSVKRAVGKSADVASGLTGTAGKSADVASGLTRTAGKSADVASGLTGTAGKSADVASGLTGTARKSADVASGLTGTAGMSADVASGLTGTARKSADVASGLTGTIRGVLGK